MQWELCTCRQKSECRWRRERALPYSLGLLNNQGTASRDAVQRPLSRLRLVGVQGWSLCATHRYWQRCRSSISGLRASRTLLAGQAFTSACAKADVRYGRFSSTCRRTAQVMDCPPPVIGFSRRRSPVREPTFTATSHTPPWPVAERRYGV